jgi:hypothetical protein
MSGCGGPDEGPLELAGSSNILDPLDRGAWFNVVGCSRSKGDTEVDIMITSVSPSGISGARPSEIRTLVAWPSGDPASDVISAPGTPPDYYRPLSGDVHTGGTLAGCSVSFAIVLPRAVRRPVEVHGLDVTYEADGETYSAHADVDLALCPEGTKAGGERCSGQM